MHRERRRCGLCLTSHTRLVFPPAVDSLPRSVDRAGCHLAQQEWYRPCSSCSSPVVSNTEVPKQYSTCSGTDESQPKRCGCFPFQCVRGVRGTYGFYYRVPNSL